MNYNRLNPLHWVIALFSNSRKSDYLKPDTLHVDPSPYKATQRIRYWLRNPAHDFMHYIVGFEGDAEFRTVWGDALATLQPGWTLALRRWRWLPLPYVSYESPSLPDWDLFQWQPCRTTIQAYAGWRPSGGFGLKLRRKP